MIYIFYILIILVITYIMVKHTKINMRNLKNNKNKKYIKKTKKFLEKFNIYNNNLNLDDTQIKECNKILVDNENDCNCFIDNNKEFTEDNIKKCILNKNTKKCIKYNKCKKQFTNLLTGAEPKYNPDEWASPIIEGSHNCYAYFLNDKIPQVKNKCRKLCLEKNNCKEKIKECRGLKPQPGNYAFNIGRAPEIKREYSCPKIIDKVLLDNIDYTTGKNVIHKTNFETKCPPNHYKGAVVVHPDKTYHFYRQDSNGRFSHKQGTLRVENKDSSSKPIYAPHLSDRNYNKDNKIDGINYTDFCTYFCIPKNGFLDTNAV